MKLSEVLKKAVAKFGPNGEYWIKGTEHKAGPKGEDLYCSLGAMRAVAKEHGNVIIPLAGNLSVDTLFGELSPKHLYRGSIAGMNDSDATTFADVKKTFERVIGAAIMLEQQDEKTADEMKAAHHALVEARAEYNVLCGKAQQKVNAVLERRATLAKVALERAAAL